MATCRVLTGFWCLSHFSLSIPQKITTPNTTGTNNRRPIPRSNQSELKAYVREASSKKQEVGQLEGGEALSAREGAGMPRETGTYK